MHYALLGHWTAVAMNGFIGVQTVVAIALVHRPGLRFVYYTLMPVLVLATFVTWQGLPSVLSLTATMLSTVGRMQTNETALRVLMLASTPFWAAHDLVVGSLPGLIADLLSMATGAVMLLRSPATAPVTRLPSQMPLSPAWRYQGPFRLVRFTRNERRQVMITARIDKTELQKGRSNEPEYHV